MSREDWVTICNVRTLAEHYEAVAAGKKDSYACNPGEIAEALRSAADMLERLPRWISVEERLPDNGDTVWCFDADGVGLCEYNGPHSGFQTYGASCDTEGLHSETLLGVTHWMELQSPEPPEVTK